MKTFILNYINTALFIHLACSLALIFLLRLIINSCVKLKSNSIDFTDEVKDEIYTYSSDTKIPDAFVEHGGIPNFSQQVTIIGQTYEGFDVIDKLTNLEVQPSSDDKSKIPVEDIMVISVEIGKYSESGTEK